jgi:hypothetical protein
MWSSHTLDLVVTHFLDVCSVPPGLCCSPDVGLVLAIRKYLLREHASIYV